MSFFALSPAAPPEAFAIGERLFFIGVLVCFVRVGTYALAQQGRGTLLDGPRAPEPFRVRGTSGWPFIVCVVVLLFLQSPLYMVLVLAGLTGLLIETGRTATQQFGLGRMSFGALTGWSLLVCGAVIFIELPLGWVVDHLMTSLDVPHPEQQSVNLFRRLTRPPEIAFFLVQAAVIAPLLEELFFRGFLFTFLKNYTSTGLALFFSAGVFAFAHLNLGSVAQLWLLGLVLGIAYEQSGSLLLPIGIHACWNFLTAMSLLLDRGGG